MNDQNLLWSVVAAVVMVVGLFGVVFPVLPGLALIWAAAMAYGFLVEFGTIGWTVMAILTVILIASVVKGIVIPKKAATESGASGWAQLGGVAGGVIGFFVIPFFGMFIGALGGMALVELYLKDDWDQAWTAVKGTAKGFGISALIDFGLGSIMILAWAVWAGSILLG